MKNLSYAQIVEIYNQCHGPNQTRDISVMAWAERMERMIGPDDGIKGFLIRGREKHTWGMYLMKDGMTWCGFPRTANQWNWAETAVKITNNPKLEAIRINLIDTAIDYKGRIVANFGGRDKDG